MSAQDVRLQGVHGVPQERPHTSHLQFSHRFSPRARSQPTSEGASSHYVKRIWEGAWVQGRGEGKG